MKEMPRHSPFRPHFMAPGPQVEIMEDKSILFGESISPNKNTSDGDEDSTGYKYYRSTKILGKLFDAIDEQDIFRRVQQTSSQNGLQKTARDWDRNRCLLEGVWDYLRDAFPNVQWEIHLEQAIGIKDEKVLPSILPRSHDSSRDIC